MSLGWLGRRWWLLALVAALALFPLTGSVFLLTVMVFAGLYTILGIGLNLLTGYTGQPSFGHVAFYASGAYASALLTTRLGWPPWLALVVGAVGTGVVAYAIGIPMLRLRGHYLALGTLALGEITFVLLVQLRPLTGGPIGIAGIPPLEAFGFTVRGAASYYYVVWATTLVLLWVTTRLVGSRTGRALRAVRGDERAAESIGVHAAHYKTLVFALSAAYASIAGSLYAHFVTFVSPDSFTLSTAVLMVVIIVVGGIGTIWGAVIGGVALTLLAEVLLRPYKDYSLLFYGLLLVLVLTFMPSGVAGAARALWTGRFPRPRARIAAEPAPGGRAQ